MLSHGSRIMSMEALSEARSLNIPLQASPFATALAMNALDQFG